MIIVNTVSGINPIRPLSLPPLPSKTSSSPLLRITTSSLFYACRWMDITNLGSTAFNIHLTYLPAIGRRNNSSAPAKHPSPKNTSPLYFHHILLADSNVQPHNVLNTISRASVRPLAYPWKASSTSFMEVNKFSLRRADLNFYQLHYPVQLYEMLLKALCSYQKERQITYAPSSSGQIFSSRPISPGKKTIAPKPSTATESTRQPSP